MGWFDFLKKKKEKPAMKEQPQEAQEGSVQYETTLTARQLTNDPRVIQRIVDKMVDEDPFKQFYTKNPDGQTRSSARVYEYESITTMNISLETDESNQLQLFIEGVLLGTVPPPYSEEIKQHHSSYMLTAYAYITGGQYKEYSAETNELEEGFSPYDLDIFLQFS